MVVYEIRVRAIDHTDLAEEVTLTGDVARCYPTEQYLLIETDPTGFGGYKSQECLPWHRIDYFRKREE